MKIADIKAPELDIYARLPEVQLLRLYEPKPGIFIAESPIVIERALDAGYEPVSVLAEERQMNEMELSVLARCGDIPVYTAPMEVLKELTGFALIRGMLCAMKRKQLPSVAQVCGGAKRIAVLEDVVNPTNVGAIFRSAAALHMNAVLLTRACSNQIGRASCRERV